ncbi:MAG: hypothetical protein HY240_07405 [Actinobacteria bacterium]|nr:hypothetical protein [Actinomycetota bacterium]
MSNKKKRRQGAPRQVAERRGPPRASAEPEQRPGLFGGLFGNPVPASLSAMPNFRRSLGRGFLLVGSVPVLLLAPFLWTLVTWLGMLALGYVGPPSLPLNQASSIPPLSVGADLQGSLVLFGQPAGIVAVLPLLVLRALVVAVLAGLIVEGFERGSVSVTGVLRGLRALPIVLGGVILNLLFVILLVYAAAFGPGLGTLVQVLLPAAALWLLGFLPFVAVTERRSLPAALSRSAAGGRTPGGRQFLFSMMYLLLLTVLQAFTPPAGVTANPPLRTWIFALVVNFLHVGFFASFGFRWLVIRGSVPEPAHQPVRR